MFPRVDFFFDRSLEFSDAPYVIHTDFFQATFKKRADFLRATFKERVDFLGATFNKSVRFVEAAFKGDALFRGATFGGYASFARRKAGQVIGFDLPSRFLPCFWRSPRPFRFIGKGETAYRLAKQCAQEHGDYRSAGDYHYAEQCAINWQNRKCATWRPWKPAFWTRHGSPLGPLLELFFARGIFGYGEKPVRPLVCALLVIFVCAVLYSFGGLITGQVITTHDPLSALYFSVVTFTTLGYGDLQPGSGWMRAVAGYEALCGAALMALFIVALARKFTR